MTRQPELALDWWGPLGSDEGKRRKREALDGHERDNGFYLGLVRDRLREECLATGRPVSTDDAWRLCRPVIERLTSTNALGATFRTQDWLRWGKTESVRPSAHANSLDLWMHTEAVEKYGLTEPEE